MLYRLNRCVIPCLKVFVLVVLRTAKRAKMSMILSEFIPDLLERVDASNEDSVREVS